jgi:RecA/RadA recombinase
MVTPRVKKQKPKDRGRRKAPPSDPRERLEAMAQVASSMKHWMPARTVLTRVRALPTMWPGLDLATRVGGWPLQRIGLVHGPTAHGKTTFTHGLGLSFLRASHWYAYIDAEYTTPEDWLGKLLAEHADNPGFVAMRPRTYEQTVDAVRSFVETLSEAREKNLLPIDTTALIVVDSIRKLVPERLMKKIAEKGAEGDGSIDGAGGSAAMYKAALNAQWLDELVPLLFHHNASMLFIAREHEKTDAGKWAAKFVVGGGKALGFDSSLTSRVTLDEPVKQGDRVVAERHRVQITKTKVSAKEGRSTEWHFHTSNGRLVPEGFDIARDLIELGLQLGVLKKSGKSELTLLATGEAWRGVNEAVPELTARPYRMRELDEQVRAKVDERLAAIAQEAEQEIARIASEDRDAEEAQA